MFFCRNFFFSQCRKNQQGNPSVLCFRKSLVAKIFMDKKGGKSRVSVDNFLSDSAENFRSGTLYCVINFGYRKFLCFRGLCNDFLSKKFSSHSAKKVSRGSLLCYVSEIFRLRKSLQIRRRGKYQDFPSKCFFVSQCRKMP